jgi:nitrogen regulatory protein PII
MKKIEAIIDPDTLEAVKLHLAEIGIGGRLTAMQANGLEDTSRFYECEGSGESPWKPCFKLDLIVSDRQAPSAVNLILQHAKPNDGQGINVHINIVSLDATFATAPDEISKPSNENRKSKGRGSLPDSVRPEIAAQPSAKSGK